MPWTVEDVSRFNKGLTAAQRRRWVRVANDALARCRRQGGDNCEASAIRQANAVVQNNMEIDTRFYIYNVVTANYTIREEMLDGKKHLVVPVIMMKEGVHNGSHGPIFHSSEELSKIIDAWNGIPVTVGHPQQDGENVPANSPRMFNTVVIGRIFNARYEDGLRAEAWIDEQKILSVSPLALAYIRQGRPLDVSVGVFSDAEYTEGEWNGENYEAIAHNYRPDHLALLPGEHGACSWADGCGIRANNEGGKMEDLLKVFKELGQKGLAVSPITNEKGYADLLGLIQAKLDSMDNDERTYFLEEVYNDTVIYRVRTREGGSTLYRRGYSVNGNEVTLAEDPVEVRKDITYVAMKEINNNSNGGQSMSDKKEKPCCEAKVDALIANKQTQWTAEDREWLLSLEEAAIDKMSPVEEKKDPDLFTQAEKDKAVKDFKGGLKTIEDYTALMPEEMKTEIDAGVKLYREKRDALIKNIAENSEFTAEDLASHGDETLEKLMKSIKKVADYSGQGAGGASKDVKPYVPGVDEAE